MKIPRKYHRAKGKFASSNNPKKAAQKESAKEVFVQESAVIPDKPSYWEEMFSPLARMLGHMVGTSLSFMLFCGGEMLMHKVYAYLLSYAAVEQLPLFKFGETAIFYVGFLWWFISMIRSTVHAVKAEVKNIPH